MLESVHMTGRTLRESLGRIQNRAEEAKKARRTMHSEMHALAKDISEYCGEPGLFARYLGRIKRVGLTTAYQAFSDLKDGRRRRAIKEPAKWWMWRTKYLMQDTKTPQKK